jgi:predicted dehydrogenase/sugar phosphate isomerase/epimerase
MQILSFMSANFVARQLDYRMPDGWGQWDAVAQAWFRPLETFGERFAKLLDEIKDAGFEAIDLWVAHLHPLWATPEHVALAKAALAERQMRIVSLAGGFGATPAEFRASCRLAAELDVTVLGGGTPLLEKDRATLVSTLREFGLVFGLENHPERTPADLLGRLGQGDEDVIGVAVDTGWFGTAGYDAAEALRELAPRLKHVHLKDVKAPRAEKTGFPFIDMGHETCALGEGIVPVKRCLEVLVEADYRGAIALEHEPEEGSPVAAVQESLQRVRAWRREAWQGSVKTRPIRVAIVGCGNISGAYGRNLEPYAEVHILGATDVERARAEAFVASFGGRVYDDLEAVLRDPEVDVVVNLTIHFAHVAVITRCLQAGKHVHSEKPIAMTYAEAKQLVDLAAAKNLRLSSAPTTWLGEAQQTAWRMIRRGEIGTPRVAYAEVNWGRIEFWHPNPGPFYEVGPVFDVAVYPLTLLTAWFGPARRVVADGGVVYPHRQTKEGKAFTITTPEWTCALIELESGVRARVTSSFYVAWNTRQRGLEVHGDAGMIALDRWDVFDTALWHGGIDRQGLRRVPLARPGAPGIEFGRGVVELARALRENRPHRTPGAHAAHVIEICEAVHGCLKDGKPRTLASTFTGPAPMEWAE